MKCSHVHFVDIHCNISTLNNYLEENLHLIYFHDSNDIYTFQEDILACPFISPSITSIPLPTNTQNGRVAGLVVICFRFQKIIPKYLTSNLLSQIVTSNPRLQPDTYFAVDMFPYKKTELLQKSGLKSKPPKKPGNTPLSGTYLSFLDIKTTVSTVVSLSQLISSISFPLK